jgi:hypothetical protein
MRTAKWGNIAKQFEAVFDEALTPAIELEKPMIKKPKRSRKKVKEPVGSNS